MIQEGGYPNKYMDSWEKFEKTKLPLKNTFYRRPNMNGISKNDHEHVKKIWDTIKKSQGCFRNTYLKTDVLLLADVFETFRNTC